MRGVPKIVTSIVPGFTDTRTRERCIISFLVLLCVLFFLTEKRMTGFFFRTAKPAISKDSSITNNEESPGYCIQNSIMQPAPTSIFKNATFHLKAVEKDSYYRFYNYSCPALELGHSGLFRASWQLSEESR